jgi:phage terminase large subunit GpA-like protein
MGQPVAQWVLPAGKRNEALDTLVGALAVRRSLPRRLVSGLEYSETSVVRRHEVHPPADEAGADPAETATHEAVVSVTVAHHPQIVRPIAVASDPYL